MDLNIYGILLGGVGKDSRRRQRDDSKEYFLVGWEGGFRSAKVAF